MNADMKRILAVLLLLVLLSATACQSSGPDRPEETGAETTGMEEVTDKGDDTVELHPLLKQLESLVKPLADITPSFRRVSELDPVGLSNVYAGLYKSVSYRTLEETEVFAYIGLPEGADAEHPVPAVVCVHGGGGKAYPQWVKYWNDKGYAAIAMDTYGKAPTQAETTPYYADTGVYHALSGPRFDGMPEVNDPSGIGDSWMFHSIAAAILAGNLLRSTEGVDAGKIGITGISWGSHILMNTVSWDQRFSFAIPVYGSGCLPDSEGLFSTYFKGESSGILWDPTARLAGNSVPLLLFNGDSDPHFSVRSTERTYEAVPNTTILIRHSFPHSHPEGWSKPEIYAFADAVCGKRTFGQVTELSPSKEMQSLTVTLPEGAKLIGVTCYYMKTAALSYDLTVTKSADAWQGEWLAAIGTVNGNTAAVSIPSSAKRAYAEISYQYCNTTFRISTPLREY